MLKTRIVLYGLLLAVFNLAWLCTKEEPNVENLKAASALLILSMVVSVGVYADEKWEQWKEDNDDGEDFDD